MNEWLKYFPDADKDGDGVITKDEIKRYLQWTEEEGRRRTGKGVDEELCKPDITDIKYGPAERNVFDFWKAESEKPTPVVIWFHGGGFENGSKDTVRNRSIIRKLLSAGVSFASANYRLRDTTPIQDILRDGARVVQFLRYHAADYNIDKSRIAVFGGSAGAGMSFWIGVHDDLADPGNSDPVLRESSRVSAVVGFGVQCSYDMDVWARLVYSSKEDSRKKTMIHRFYGFSSPEEMTTPEGRKIIADVDMYGLLTKDDPPMFFFSQARNIPPDMPGYSGNHHPRHALAVQEKADTFGVPCEVYLLFDEPKLPDDKTTDDVVVPFLLKHLGITP